MNCCISEYFWPQPICENDVSLSSYMCVFAPHSHSLCSNLWRYCVQCGCDVFILVESRNSTIRNKIPSDSHYTHFRCFPRVLPLLLISSFIFFAKLSSLHAFTPGIAPSCYTYSHFYFYLMDLIILFSARTPFQLSPLLPLIFLDIRPALQLLHISPTFLVIITLSLSIACFLLFLEWQFSSSVALISQMAHKKCKKKKKFHFQLFCSWLLIWTLFHRPCLIFVNLR